MIAEPRSQFGEFAAQEQTESTGRHGTVGEVSHASVTTYRPREHEYRDDAAGENETQRFYIL